MRLHEFITMTLTVIIINNFQIIKYFQWLLIIVFFFSKCHFLTTTSQHDLNMVLNTFIFIFSNNCKWPTTREDHWENPSPWSMIIFLTSRHTVKLFLNLIPMVARPVICGSNIIFHSLRSHNFEICQRMWYLLKKSFCYWHNKQKPPKPSNIKFHYVKTDQSGVVLKIAAQYDHALKLDLKKVSLEANHIWRMGSLESFSLVDDVWK